MTERKLHPSKDERKEANDRIELFHDFIVNYIVHHSVYKLNKDFSKHIDICLVEIEKAQTKI